MVKLLRRLQFYFPRMLSSRALPILALLFIIAAVPLTVFLAQTRQDPRQRAAESAESDDLYKKFKNTEFVSNEFLVKFKPEIAEKLQTLSIRNARGEISPTNTGDARLNELNEKSGVENMRQLVVSTGRNSLANWYKVRLLGSEKLLNIKDIKDKKEQQPDQKSSIEQKYIAPENLSSDPDFQQLFLSMETYKNSSMVELVEPNFVLRTQVTPNDPDFTRLWGLNNTGQTDGTVDADIDATEAWDVASSSGTNAVGIVDTGIDYNHPDLQSNIWRNEKEIPNNGIDDDENGFIDDVYGYDFRNRDGDPMDDSTYSHGTHVAGIIGAVANNNTGITGVAWNVKLMALKFLNANGYGYTGDAVSAIAYATAMGVKITNNSWGGGLYSRALYDVISNANEEGALFIASAGNLAYDNDIYSSYPASYNLPNIISVASTDHKDNRSPRSNYGLNSVDLGAPGSKIYSTIRNGGYISYSGTSMAAPHVSGAAILVWQKFPSLTHLGVKQQLLITVDTIPPLVGKTVTGGRLNAYNALTNTSMFYIPSSLNITLKSGTTARASIVLSNTFVSPSLTWNVTPQSNWLTTSVQSGEIPQSSYQQVIVNIDATSLQAGSYTSSLNFTSSYASHSNFSIPVTANIISKHNVEWANRLGGTEGDYGRVTTTDIYGNVYVAASFRGTVVFGDQTFTSSASDIVTIKYDRLGNLLWARQGGGTGDVFSDFVSSITTDQTGNVYVAGYFNNSITFGDRILSSAGLNDIFVVKYDSAGNIIWAIRDGGTSTENPTSIAIDAFGNTYITGVFYGTARFGSVTLIGASSTTDVFIVKYNADGNFIWANRAGGFGLDKAVDVKVDTFGDVYVLENFSPPNATFESVTLASEFEHVFLAKYNGSGDLIWVKQPEGASSGGDSLTIDNTGNVYILGKYSGSVTFGDKTLDDGFGDMFLAKYDRSGNAVFAKQLTASYYESGTIFPSSIIVDSEGNLYIAGGFSEQLILTDGQKLTTFDYHYRDIFILKYDNAGNFLWAEQTGETSRAVAKDIAIDSINNIYITGNFQNTINFDGKTLTSSSAESDIFIVKYAPVSSSSLPTPTLLPRCFTDTDCGVGQSCMLPVCAAPPAICSEDPDNAICVRHSQSCRGYCVQQSTPIPTVIPTPTIASKVISSSKPSPCGTLGDVDADGFVTTADSQEVLKIAAALPPYNVKPETAETTEKKKRADVNASSTVTGLDSLLIQRYIFGQIKTFTACAKQ